MPAAFRFEPEARAEFTEAASYYATEAGSSEVAQNFARAVQTAITTICVAPKLWRIVGRLQVRRYVIQRFPFVLYYRFIESENLVVIYAVAHTSRHPAYWRSRLSSS